MCVYIYIYIYIYREREREREREGEGGRENLIYFTSHHFYCYYFALSNNPPCLDFYTSLIVLFAPILVPF